MFAGGIGVTPPLALLWDLPYRAGAATLVYRARSAGDLAFRAELDWLAHHRGLRVVPLLGARADHSSWLPREYAAWSGIDALREIAPGLAAHQVYVCGPEGWADAVRADVRAAGVPAQRLHTERFAW